MCDNLWCTVGKWIASCSKRRCSEGSGSHVFRSEHGHGHDEEEPVHDSSSGSGLFKLNYMHHIYYAYLSILTCIFFFFSCADTYICMGELLLFRFRCRYVYATVIPAVFICHSMFIFLYLLHDAVRTSKLICSACSFGCFDVHVTRSVST